MRHQIQSLSKENLKELLQIVNDEVAGTIASPGGTTGDVTVSGYTCVGIARLLTALDDEVAARVKAKEAEDAVEGNAELGKVFAEMNKLELSTLLKDVREEARKRDEGPAQHENLEVFDHGQLEGVVIEDFEQLDVEQQQLIVFWQSTKQKIENGGATSESGSQGDSSVNLPLNQAAEGVSPRSRGQQSKEDTSKPESKGSTLSKGRRASMFFSGLVMGAATTEQVNEIKQKEAAKTTNSIHARALQNIEKKKEAQPQQDTSVRRKSIKQVI